MVCNKRTEPFIAPVRNGIPVRNIQVRITPSVATTVGSDLREGEVGGSEGTTNPVGGGGLDGSNGDGGVTKAFVEGDPQYQLVLFGLLHGGGSGPILDLRQRTNFLPNSEVIG